MKQLFLAIILSLSYANVPAEMYKWVDDEGNVQYTQTPPPASTQATTVTPSTTNAISGVAKEESSATDKNAPAEKSNGNPQLLESCEKTSKNLNKLTSRQELVEPDKEEPGKFVVMSEETRQQQIIMAKAYLQAYCKEVKVTEERSTETANREATARTNTKANSCEQTRQELALVESTSDLVVQDQAKPDKFVPLTKEKREQKITQMKANMERFCKK
jgi:hypothetical protein